MSISRRKKTRIGVIIFSFIAALLSAFFLYFFMQQRRRPAYPPYHVENILKDAVRKRDMAHITFDAYDTVFLSTFPINTYDPADYLYFYALTLLKTDYVLPDFFSLQSYMERIAKSDHTVSTVYLGIRPDRISAGEIALLADAWPDLNFEVILACPSIEYWRQLSDSEYKRTLDAYCDFLSDINTVDRVHAYFLSANEWLIANPALYNGSFSLAADAMHLVMAISTTSGYYQVTSDNADILSASLTELTAAERTAPTVYPDLSDTAIVFFGDSVTGNYTNGMSIPGAVHGLTGATVYNCGYGGNSAAMREEYPIALAGIAAAFAEQDPSVLPEGTQVYAGFLEYAETPPETDKLCFVINYGLNDYFCQLPITTEDPYDIFSFNGAIRTAINCLKENYADARIFLCTPNYTSFVPEEMQLPLEEYINAVIALARELDVELIDNYGSLGIDETNYELYLADTVHPNETGRFMMARKIISAIDK
ncbi:MAG: GDSL-type esterase/lipase family protein [Butyrivibrio sp.]|nr:GDSL-type esterase/lipase family protein [Acetatifactor muris]MCM1559870.1 GDSL-type esterase/lipase family protein [Butyrivibrio sp.]